MNGCRTVGSIRPKRRVNSKLVHLVNQHHDVVTEHFAQRLVDHRNIRLAAERVSKLTLHYAERGFDVGTLVVVLLPPRPTTARGG